MSYMSEDGLKTESVSGPSKPKIDWKNEIQQYGFATAVSAVFFVILSLFIYYRRGYYDLYIANKAFAGAAAIVLGLVLLIGTGNRLFSFSARFVQYRKGFGFLSCFLALAHGIISFFFLPSKFPLSGYLGQVNWWFIYGLLATVAFIAVFVISNNWAMRALGGRRWWRLQSWGVRLAFMLVLLHVFVMKWQDWVKWYKSGGGPELAHPELPGGGLLVGWFLTIVLVIRIAEHVNPKLGRIVWYAGLLTLPVIYVATIWWGRQFAG